ncbi:ornithine cyclodeaminase family protein [Oceanidesulfovibrio marinus]|uniref:Ornithine cyclodeaminase n=1 Tax=Oceanidesulfovibrio marinus TaxID=370038 RepID=A0A6P1ZFZ3_9BACT|nr:ornithine cyclodeaminase [Oceanidesulfovibrio marinus]TVM33680.1 ornithine cyclodeaminase [Oceanidesulfovibrio marinus]
MNASIITYDATVDKLTWPGAVEALRSGHLLPRAQVDDIFLGPAEGTLLSRGAYIEGLGYGVKSTTIFAGNAQAGLPSVQGAMLMFEPEHGRLTAIIESRLITEFKTAADSVLGASLLARPESATLLIVGAGTVARSLVKAYSAVFPKLERIAIWARRTEQAAALAREFEDYGVEVDAVPELAAAAREADIIATATMARGPVLHGAWVRPGTHVDLIGAYKADMREADDSLIAGGALFVDSRETTIGHIGELAIPIANGVITADPVQGDFYDMIQNPSCGRQSDTEITVFKNGGGAHLDLMMARYIAERAEGS